MLSSFSRKPHLNTSKRGQSGLSSADSRTARSPKELQADVARASSEALAKKSAWELEKSREIELEQGLEYKRLARPPLTNHACLSFHQRHAP